MLHDVKPLAGAAVACALALFASHARAGGLEYTGAGAESLGRAGAVTARADDPMVLMYNPAGLAELRGSQFLLNINVAIFDACVDPAGYYGWGLYLGGRNSVLRQNGTGRTLNLDLHDATKGATSGTPEHAYYDAQLDTVCLDQNVVPIPQIAWTTRLSERVGIGAGLIFPSVQPSGRWGGRDGVINGADGSLRPAPTRYMMLSATNIGVFPTIGAGYRITNALRLGLSLEWGMISINNFTMATAGGGTIPANDIVAHVKGQDWFVPAFTVSTHVVPVDALDIVLAFRFQDDVNAKGNLDVTTGLFDPSLRPHTTGGLEVTSIRQHMPWKLRAGVRYADRFAPRPSGTGKDEADPAGPERIHDPLQDERWDLELDAEYQMNARNDKQVLDYRSGQQIEFVPAMTNQVTNCAPGARDCADFPNANVPFTEIQKNWRNQLSLRLGGTVNLVPGLFGVSAGVNYENRGVDPSFMQVDFWPLSRVGVHAGVIVRVAKSIDFVASYGHIFQETLIVQPPPDQSATTIWNCYIGKPAPGDVCAAPKGKIETISQSTGPMTTRESPAARAAAPRGTPDGTAKLTQTLTQTAQDQPAWIVNSGRYRSHFDVLAVGAKIHF